MMQKTVTYLYPDVAKASHLKVFQDRTNQIKAFYFTKENVKEIEKMDTSTNYAVYFLFDNSEVDANKVYIGQSQNGILRMADHVRNKDFWTYCIMFVTDNNSFDKLAIDFMEYEFINKLKKSSYILVNKDLRQTVPNVSIYDMPTLLSYTDQIEFLLNAEGIVIDEMKPDGDVQKYYYPRSNKHKARIFVKDGQFILVKGSELKRPPESSKDWKSDRHYVKKNAIIDDYIDDGKIEEKEGKLISLINLSFSNPSLVASLISGTSENGWMFFKDLNEFRKIDEEGVR